MPDNLSDKTRIDKAFKYSQNVVGTDPEKSSFEETIFHRPYISSGDIFKNEVPYDNPEAAISQGVVSSGVITLTKDATVGGAYRGYRSETVKDFIHPARYGNNYAPIFLHNGGEIINDGELFADAVFDYRDGYLLIERNTTTDQWIEPIEIDAYYYTGEYGVGGDAVGDVTKEYVDQQDATLSGLIIQLSGTSGVAEYVLDQVSGTLGDHGNLNGLADDDHEQYRHIDGRRDKHEYAVACNNTGSEIPAYTFVVASGDCAVNDVPGTAIVNSLTAVPLGLSQSAVADGTIGTFLKRGRINIPSLDTSGEVNSDLSFNISGQPVIGSSPAIGTILDGSGTVYINIGGGAVGSGGGGFSAADEEFVKRYTFMMMS